MYTISVMECGQLYNVDLAIDLPAITVESKASEGTAPRGV